MIVSYLEIAIASPSLFLLKRRSLVLKIFVMHFFAPFLSMFFPGENMVPKPTSQVEKGGFLRKSNFENKKLSNGFMPNGLMGLCPILG